MRIRITGRRLLGACALVVLTFAYASSHRGDARGDEQPGRAEGAGTRAISYLKEVRPILAQHCFQCHGPDEAARKGKLRLDLKDHAFADHEGKRVIAPGVLDGSLVWERIAAADESERMPPKGKAEPLTEKQIATVKTWIEQGARWEDHWSFLPPTKPTVPEVSDKAWVRDPIDAFVLVRLEREHLKPEPEAGREVWLRRASFDLTGLPPTAAEIDAFLRDKGSDSYEKQVERLLESTRYGEHQAQEWLDLARYADTSGYQNDTPRMIWKWREWVINAFNSNMPFDQFAIEQLAGDLLPNATLSQKVATGFNRNHPTNSEPGEEEDEYRSAYVVDRVNTTATVFMGLTLACTQCHDHKYDPFSQRDYYSFYAFFNNIKERDSEFGNPRPKIPVPNPDQEPRLADLKTRIEALKERLERDDSMLDAAQKGWESKTLARLGKPIEWTTPPPSGMASRNGSLLKLLDDGSILSTGPAPVKDTYDVMVLPGKKRITALRLEVLPDEHQPGGALGRASDGRFNLSAIEIRNSAQSESQDTPLVYISRAEADINQKPKEDPLAFDMLPGPIDSAIVTEPVGTEGGLGAIRFGGGWSIVNDERKRSHEAIFLPLEPLETNEASVLRISLHHLVGSKFKSLIGRFRISYTEDNTIRELLLPAQTKVWSSIGPFPAEDLTKAYATAFEPEKDIKTEPLDLKKSYEKIVLAVQHEGEGSGAQSSNSGAKPNAAEKPASDSKPAEGAPATPPAAKPERKPPEKKAENADGAAKPEAAPQTAKTTDEKGAQASEGKSPPTTAAESSTGNRTSKKDGSERSKKVGDSSASETNKASDPGTKAETTKTAKQDSAGAEKRNRPAEKITWIEQRKWRDGAPARLQGANSAYYLTRKILSTQPRTAMVQIDGPAGFKMWLNGEVVQSSDPEPPAAPVAPAKKAESPATATETDSGMKSEDEMEEPPGPDFENFDPEPLMLRRPRSTTEKKFRIGLRKGENEIVVKVVSGSGVRAPGRGGINAAAAKVAGAGGNGGFTFDLTPDGDDVLTHEVATALRLKALEDSNTTSNLALSKPFDGSAASDSPAKTAGATSSTSPPTSASKEASSTSTDSSSGTRSPSTRGASGAVTSAAASNPPVAAKSSLDELDKKTVSLVGEKSAPLRSDEEENKLTPSQRRQKVLREYYRSHVDPVGRLIAEELAKLKDEERQVKRTIPQTLVMEELEKPRQAYIFKRGLYKNRGENVDPGTPAVLPPMAKGLPRNRLGLAKWLVSAQNPLTARVLVNRIWNRYFGTGIVRTAEDYGVRGELPTHPELLDYLATELVDSKWDLKKLQKRIVLSAVYRQSSTASKEKRELDPENRLLARGPRMRLTAEMIRDNALAVSGLLHEQIGGPSVKPVQPKNAWKTVEGNMASAYRRDRDEKQYRRALYVYWKRGSPYPSMVNFDAVKRDSCTVTRAITTTPVQALTLLNDPVFVECAKMLGQRMLKDREAMGRARDLKKPEEDAKRLAYGFRLCTSRQPTEEETEILRKLLDDERAHFQADASAAKKLLGVGDAKLDETLNPAEVAAWTCVANALLNLDSTIHH
jgi:hypothetical protein